MSECVVRMEMPKCCDDCDANYDCCACGISGEFWFRNPRYKEFDSSKECLPNCPIICSLPEGHGRLIDADSMEKEVCGGCVHGEHKYTNCIDCALANAPTIIPAEVPKEK